MKASDAKAATAETQKTDEDVGALLKFRTRLPCVGCGESHRFTARKKLTDRFKVICPKYSDSPMDDPEIIRLREQEKQKVNETFARQRDGKKGNTLG